MEMKTFRNPLSVEEAADPQVQYHKGWYYTLVTLKNRIEIFRSRSLATALQEEHKLVFSLCHEVQSDLWAPELHFLPSTGRWYIYACGEMEAKNFGTMRMFCLESVSDDPYGDYVFKGYTDPNTLAIDQTVFYAEETGALYTAFSQFTDMGQVITLAEMDDPWTVSDRRLRVSYPRFDWEKQGPAPEKDQRVNEGPFFLSRNGKLYLFYSASGCWSEYYCLGMLEYTGSDFRPENVINEKNWKKSETSVFSAANGVYGVGHCAFFDSPDGRETWITYHGMSAPDVGEDGRLMYAQRISFDASGTPVLGAPLARETEIPLPSGE